MPRFASIKRLRAAHTRAAANDNSPNSIYTHSSEIEDLLRRLGEPANPRRHAPAAFDRVKRGAVIAAIATALAFVWFPACVAGIGFLKLRHVHIEPLGGDPLVQNTDGATLPASVDSPSTLTEDDLQLRAVSFSPEQFRGSIADTRPEADRVVLLPPKQPRKRVSNRSPQPARVPTAVTPAPPSPPPSPSPLETMFGLRTFFGQTSPQT
jgi:hypothetical protein